MGNLGGTATARERRWVECLDCILEVRYQASRIDGILPSYTYKDKLGSALDGDEFDWGRRWRRDATTMGRIH